MTNINNSRTRKQGKGRKDSKGLKDYYGVELVFNALARGRLSRYDKP